MTTKYKVLKLAKELNVGIEFGPVGSGSYEVTADSPENYQFAGSGLHCLVESCNRGPWGYDDLWAHIYEDLKEGLEECPDTCPCKE